MLEVRGASETAETQEPEYPSKHPSPSAAEKALRYRALGLSEARLDAFLRSGVSLTAWYNEKHIGGYGLKVGGTILVALGTISLLAAVTITGLFWGAESRKQRSDDDGALGIVIAIFVMPVAMAGVIELGAGIPMVVLGNRRIRRWAKEGELDRAPIEELKRRRDQSHPKPKATFSLLPYLTPGGGGLGLSLRF